MTQSHKHAQTTQSLLQKLFLIMASYLSCCSLVWESEFVTAFLNVSDQRCVLEPRSQKFVPPIGSYEYLFSIFVSLVRRQKMSCEIGYSSPEDVDTSVVRLSTFEVQAYSKKRYVIRTWKPFAACLRSP